MVLKPNTGCEVIGLVISSSRRKGCFVVLVVVGLGFFKCISHVDLTMGFIGKLLNPSNSMQDKPKCSNGIK